MALSQGADPESSCDESHFAESYVGNTIASTVDDNRDTCVSPGFKKDCWFIPILASAPRPALGPIVEGGRVVPIIGH